jgi:hypothetical protein
MKIDYTVKGTKLPIIPEGTEYRVSIWNYDDKSSQLCKTKNHFISFGWNHYKGYTYILCEKPEFEGKDYYMVKLSDIEKLTETKQEETMKTITYIDAQRIVDIACSTWKALLFNSWGKNIVLKKDINIPSENYQNMRKACTSVQHKLFDEIFGEDTPQFKIGDWVYIIKASKGALIAESSVGQITEQPSSNGLFNYEDGIHVSIDLKVWNIGLNSKLRLATEEEIKAANVFPDGTPCLVKDYTTSSWYLQYADGKGSFYSSGRKYGATINRIYSMKLDIDNLPVNE